MTKKVQLNITNNGKMSIIEFLVQSVLDFNVIADVVFLSFNAYQLCT